MHFTLLFEVDTDILISEIIDFKGGNSGLTEEFIYNNQPSSEEEQIQIFSGATLKQNNMGFVSKNAFPSGKKLKMFKRPTVLVIRKGNAGKVIYLDKDEYFSTNDDVYTLKLKNGWKDKINLIWFSQQYQNLFYNLVTSKSDNATFIRNMLKNNW